MTSPSPHAERRRADRAAASFPVRISNKPDADPAMLRDISEIGLACLSSHEVPEMTLVGLDFALPGATERHAVKGAVVRCEPTTDAKGKRVYDLAVYFTDVPPVTKAALRNYVAKGKKV